MASEDDGTTRHVPGEPGVWVLITGDLLVFGIFFCTFLVYRMQNAALYAQSQLALDRRFGLVNTLLLLTSSWFVALAVSEARARSNRRASALIAGALVCGLGFVTSKALEWHALISEGITLNSNEFYTFYYMFTGTHLFHVFIGLCVLTYMLAQSRKADVGPSYVAILEGGASFWHLVDLLWVILFPLLYLVK